MQRFKNELTDAPDERERCLKEGKKPPAIRARRIPRRIAVARYDPRAQFMANLLSLPTASSGSTITSRGGRDTEVYSDIFRIQSSSPFLRSTAPCEMHLHIFQRILDAFI
jgi:hypothetical protein